MKSYKTKEAENQGRYIEQLLQITEIVHDGDIINKSARDWLVDVGLCQRMPGGFNLITKKGIEYLLDLKLIHP